MQVNQRFFTRVTWRVNEFPLNRDAIAITAYGKSTSVNLFLPINQRILFVGEVGFFRRSLDVIYQISLKRITGTKLVTLLLGRTMIQIVSGTKRKRIMRLRIDDPGKWFSMIRQAIEDVS